MALIYYQISVISLTNFNFYLTVTTFAWLYLRLSMKEQHYKDECAHLEQFKLACTPQDNTFTT